MKLFSHPHQLDNYNLLWSNRIILDLFQNNLYLAIKSFIFLLKNKTKWKQASDNFFLTNFRKMKKIDSSTELCTFYPLHHSLFMKIIFSSRKGNFEEQQETQSQVINYIMTKHKARVCYGLNWNSGWLNSMPQYNKIYFWQIK